MVRLHIDVNQDDIDRVKTMLAGVKNGSKRVQVRAINKTLTNTQTKAVDEIYQQYNITKTNIRAVMSLFKANYSKISGAFWAISGPTPLIKFAGTRQTLKGVTVKVMRSGNRELLKHAFIATMKSGHKGVFWRKWSGQREPFVRTKSYGHLAGTKYAKPIEERFGPKVTDALDKPIPMKRVLDHAGERITYHLNHELEYELSRL